MKIKFWHLGVAFLVLAGLFSGLYLATGSYPVVSVNGSFISAREYKNAFKAVSAYSRVVAGAVSSSVSVDPKNIQAATLTFLIEDRLVAQSGDILMGSEFEQLAQKKVDQYDRSRNLHQAARNTFRLAYEDVEVYVLLPEARREILTSRLFLRGENFDEYMKEKIEKAKVRVFTSDFAWDGSKAIPR